ncbi:MAG: ABC transporter ATP-binding protein, partial [Proteobacteria bacterium]|nr:ABC transporter ATP-binding protein [Pseudomonadota bacterium]
DRLCLMHHGRMIADGSPEELKKNSEKISGSLIQVKAEKFMEVYDLLTEKFKDLSVYGSKIFLRTFEPEKTRHFLFQILENKGIKKFEASQIPVPLQEAFVDYIRESEKILY